MEGSKRTTTRISHLCSSLKNKRKNKNKIQSYDRKFVAKQYIKSLQVQYDINPEKPEASDEEMEQ